MRLEKLATERILNSSATKSAADALTSLRGSSSYRVCLRPYSLDEPGGFDHGWGGLGLRLLGRGLESRGSRRIDGRGFYRSEDPCRGYVCCSCCEQCRASEVGI